MRFFWNFHVVHHSSSQYNLSVAVRQSWFSGIAHWIFYVPVALLGFPLWSFVLMHGLNLIYQFWIHTKFIKNLGFLEYFLNTPSHHRVHHGVNNAYLDKNYAGIFIIWDRLFGTFIAGRRNAALRHHQAHLQPQLALDKFARMVRDAGSDEKTKNFLRQNPLRFRVSEYRFLRL